MVSYGGRVAADPGARDVGAGGENVNDRAVVGEGRAGIAPGGGADGADEGLIGGRGVGGVGVAVAGRDGQEVAGVDDGAGGGIEGSAVAAT